MESLSELIQRRMKELGLKKTELANLVGVSRAYIGDLANGTAKTKSGVYRPKPEIITSLAKALKVSESEILNALGHNLAANEDESITAELDENTRIKLLGGKHYTEEEKQEFLRDFKFAFGIAKQRIAEKRKRME